MSKKKLPHKENKQENFKNKLLSIFTEHPYESLNYKQISGRLKIKDQTGRMLVQKYIERLEESGLIIEKKRGKYQLNIEYFSEIYEKKTVISGIVDMKSGGKAYIIVKEGEDVFVSSDNTNRALNGDEVKVQLFPFNKGRKPEGRIIEIIKRARETYAGIFKAGKFYNSFIPDSINFPYNLIIPKENAGNAVDGDKVIVKLCPWPEGAPHPLGEVVKILGRPGLHETEMLSILAEHGIDTSFPPDVEKEAAKISDKIPESEISKRKDYRNIFTITIDPEDAKDFDDAISLQKLPDGLWEVGVHIADVSYYVRPGSKIDNEAYNRSTSVYLVDRTIPMLPEKLSNNICSLSPKSDKLCYSAIFKFDENHNIVAEWYGRTVINSNHRFNYEEVQQIIESGNGLFSEEILKLHSIAQIVREKRFRNGSIAFESEEVKFRLDEKGKPVGVYIKEYKDSNKLIEEFMLLANKRVAEYINLHKKYPKATTFVYRIHDKPNQEKLMNFTELIAKLGYSLKTSMKNNISYSMNELFSKIKGKPEENLISGLAIRTMAKAIYSTNNIGHYGLAFKYYTHFTSPIRRYPDLLVHRLFDNYLHGKPSSDKKEFEAFCVYCSEMEKKAVEAERTSVKYKQVEYMLDKVGKTFKGVISGITRWGIYVELDESKSEGMVALRTMTDDYYIIDEDNFEVIGQHGGKRYRLGDKVSIIVKNVDLHKKNIDFSFSE